MLCIRETPSGLPRTSFWRHLPDGLAKQKRKHKTGRTERRHDERTDGTDRDGATERSGAEPRGTDGRRRPERSDGAERSGDTGNGRSDGAEQTLLERTDGERVGARGRQPFQLINALGDGRADLLGGGGQGWTTLETRPDPEAYATAVD